MRDEVASVRLVSGPFALDARHHPAEGTRRGSLILAHPHPAHGGHMDHPVVVMAAERAAAAGLSVLRFDMRGVRRSEGQVTDFLGHLDDWRAAAAWAREQSGSGRHLAGGFSYGARTLAALLRPDRERTVAFDGLLLLAPATRVPRSKRDFGNLLLGRPLTEATRDGEVLRNLRALQIPTRVLLGDGDVVAPHEEVAAHLPPQAHLDVLPGLNHFFSRDAGAGRTARDLLAPALDAALAALLSEGS